MSLRMVRRMAGVGMGTLCFLALAGCEWDSSSDSYNSRYNFLNFSGVYRGVNGGLLVTDYSSELSSPNSQGSVGSTNNVESERIATGNGSTDVFSGFTDRDNVIPGSFSVSGAAFSFSDPEPFEGVLVSEGTPVGTINYGTGQWFLDFKGNVPAPSEQIIASYKYYVEPESGDPDTGTGSGPRGNATSGASGASIYAFTVEHYGNLIQITDNNGKVYEGKFGDIRSVGGVNQDSVAGGTVQAAAGDSFIASFNAEGVSAAGKNVRMAGTFQGVVQASSAEGTSYVLDERLMLGTWIESNGRTGNINGEASPIAISIGSGSTSTNAP